MLRFKAIQEATSRTAVKVDVPTVKSSDFFGLNVFDKSKMQKYLSKEAYEAVIFAIEKGTRIDRRTADQVAAGMKSWALERGASHYSHWFQPLTGSTAEKHDTFLDLDHKEGKAIESFTGRLLVQQEPDASSFPNGGIRSTFEARGYTAWDPTSPAFVIEDTLCIPSIFISYSGEALDNKTPLLRSMHLIDKAATDVCQFFDKDVNHVFPTLGWEQEYFLIDEALYYARPDLMITQRTLMGHQAAKNQQLEDHYFGSIPERAINFMRELEVECYKLAIPAKTRHNEVAPNQFELAPIFEEVNVAVDHNILLMDVMRRVARRHRFKVLLHEKPFAGVNGSGKHNNWAMATNTGVNLLQPGKNPKTNLQFLTFVVNIVKAVHENADLLLASIATVGNEHRLGANEAPPAIISVFLGSQINKMLDEIESKVSEKKMSADEKTELKLDIGRIPELLLDNTDRNRTSPFAFTGNKFEFRAVGSSANCASAMTTVNVAVARQLADFKVEVDALVNKGVKKDEAIFQMLRKLIKESKAIRFDGNNYSKEWEAEAKKRNLPNIRLAVEAWKVYATPHAKKVFCESKVYSEKELEARHEIMLEGYAKKIEIESRVLGDLAINHIIPVAIKYQTSLIENVEGLQDIFEDEAKTLAAPVIETIKEISGHTTAIKKKVKDMAEARDKADKHGHAEEKAHAYATKIKPMFDEIRTHIDALELTVDNQLWPLPKYRELLFIR